jgi:hypothetical protein
MDIHSRGGHCIYDVILGHQAHASCCFGVWQKTSQLATALAYSCQLSSALIRVWDVFKTMANLIDIIKFLDLYHDQPTRTTAANSRAFRFILLIFALPLYSWDELDTAARQRFTRTSDSFLSTSEHDIELDDTGLCFIHVGNSNARMPPILINAPASGLVKHDTVAILN